MKRAATSPPEVTAAAPSPVGMPRCLVPGCKRRAVFRVMLYRFDPDPRPAGTELIVMLDPDLPIVCTRCACADELHFRAHGRYLWARRRTENAHVILRRIGNLPWFEDEDPEMSEPI